MNNKWLNIVCAIAVIIVAAVVVYAKKGREMNSGINLDNMDLNVRPGDDFYNFATAGWQKNNPLTGEYARYGVFDKLREKNLEQVYELVNELAKKKHENGSVDQKIGDFYAVAMDEKRLNADGIKPVEVDIHKIRNIKDRGELPVFLANEIHPFTSAFWGDTVAPDMKDSTINTFGIMQSGIGLPERDYYFDTDINSTEIREKYKKFMADAFVMFGINPADAPRVYAIEEKIAKSFYKKEKLRIAEENYHLFTYDDFKKEFSGFDWDAYFDARGIKPKSIDVGQPEALTESLNILNKADLDDIKLYMQWEIIQKSMGFLHDAAYDLSFDFYGKTLTGKTEQRARWKRVIGVMDDVVGEALGEMYVKKYFPAAAKERMVKLVENLRMAYAERIKNLDWMSDETKQRALDKLGTFHAKIGYPDKFRDYTNLNISKDISYWENIKRADRFENEYWLEKIDRPVDNTLWFMNPHTVNAYYWSQTNEICFPAGILQPPFFDMNADDAFNYGAIGSVIGHEMTHGFDDQGRKFDKDGNMNDWWTDNDTKSFDKRSKVMVDFFDKILVAPDTYANGEFTLGENLADHGGITIAFTAFQMATAGKELPAKDNLTPEQRFFVAFAGTEVSNIRPEEILRLTKVDVHSLGRWRVNGILPHINAWYDAFGIGPKDKLYIAPENRVSVW